MTGLGASFALAEFLVVVGPDPFERVERARFQRGVDGVLGHRHRLGAQGLEHFAGEAADAHLEAGEIAGAVNFLAEPARHLPAGVAGGKGEDLALGEEFVDEVAAAAFLQPGGVLARVHAERRRGGEDEARILVPVIGQRGMRAFGPAVGDGVERLQRRRDFAGRRNAKREMAVGEIGERASERFAAAVDEVERGLEARRHPPLHVGRGIGEGGLRQPDAGRGDSEPRDELPTSSRHLAILPIA